MGLGPSRYEMEGPLARSAPPRPVACAVTDAWLPPFLLIRVRDGERARTTLREHGIAVRRGDTFPGLDRNWTRMAVAPPEQHDRLLAALAAGTGR
jgi:histidinol-phosphate/aromatic aminotransferase/cobyric acid decarboxylase-like protein